MKVVKYLIILLIIGVLLSRLNNTTKEVIKEPIEEYKENVKDTVDDVRSTPEIQLYYYIKKYCEIYNVPEEIVFSIAHNETRYQGPLDRDYKHNLKSLAGARGALQVMPSTYRMVMKKSITENELQNNIKLNTECAIKYLSILYEKYRDWDRVIATYASGNPNNTNMDYVHKTKKKSKNYKSNFKKL